MRFTLRKWIPLAAIGLGLVVSMGSWGKTPSPRILMETARGLIGDQRFGEASLLAGVFAKFWEIGGASGLSLMIWLGAWLTWSAAFFAVLAVGAWFIQKKPTSRKWMSGVCGGIVFGMIALGLGVAAWTWKQDRRDLRLILPVDLLAFAKANPGALFANPSLQPALRLEGLPVELSIEDAAKLSTDPTAWRSALRRSSWKTVLLSGPILEFRPLLEHLLASPDWTLASLSNQGWGFRRADTTRATLPSAESVQLPSPEETAIYLGQLSSRYEAMKATPSARACVERALELAPKEPEVRLHAANFAAARERWQDVVSHTRAALRFEPRSATAHALLARALLESGDLSAARKAAQAALNVVPNDPGTLFLLARILREEKDYRSEAETLETLVTITKKSKLPNAAYLAYLAQSYAQVGNAAAATKNYKEALATGQLDAEQAAAIRESLEIIESRSPTELPPP